MGVLKHNTGILSHNGIPLRYTYSAPPAPSYPTDGLIDFFDFNSTREGVNGNTWAIDAGSFTYSTGPDDEGYSIVNSTGNDLLTLPDSFFPGFQATTDSSDFTFAFWVNFDQSPADRGLFGKRVPHTAPAYYGPLMTNDALFNIGMNGGPAFTSSWTYVVDTWFHFIVTTVKGGTTTAYVNNSYAGSTGTAAYPVGPGASTSENFQLFRCHQSSWAQAGTKVSNFFMYDRVLDATERTQLYDYR